VNRLLALCLLAPAMALAETPQIPIVIKNHRFEPAEVHIPAGVKVRLVIENQDATPEEFESHELNLEKVIPGGSTARIFVGPLSAGRYPFVGEFNEDSAQGVLVAE